MFRWATKCIEGSRRSCLLLMIAGYTGLNFKMQISQAFVFRLWLVAKDKTVLEVYITGGYLPSKTLFLFVV